MSGKRGMFEEQITKISSILRLSEQLTKCGISSTLIISHPVEGFLYSGAVMMTTRTRDLVAGSNLNVEVIHEQTTSGRMLNHFSSRRDKEVLLKKSYSSVLPPLPVPFSEVKTFVLLQAQFTKVLEAELAGLAFKFGDDMPEELKDWFEDDNEIFKCFKAGSHTNNLNGILKARGTTITQFYRKSLRKVYSVRLGEEALENYHVNRSDANLNEHIENKKKRDQEEEARIQVEQDQFEEAILVFGTDGDEHEALVNEEEARGDRDARGLEEAKRDEEKRRQEESRRLEVVRRMEDEARRIEEDRRFQETRKLEEQTKKDEDIRRLEEARSLEIPVDDINIAVPEEARRKQEYEDLRKVIKGTITPGVLKSIHQHGKTYTESSIVQILGKNIVEGQLKSLTLGDGEFVSENVFPVDNESATLIMEIPTYELLQIEEASVKADKLILQDISHLEITNREGLKVQIKEAIEVKKLRKLTKDSMQLLSVQFPNLTKVEFNCHINDANATIYEDDPALKEVGKKTVVVKQIQSISQPAPASSRPKRKMIHCPWCVRAFTDSDNYKKHIQNEH